MRDLHRERIAKDITDTRNTSKEWNQKAPSLAQKLLAQSRAKKEMRQQAAYTYDSIDYVVDLKEKYAETKASLE